MTFQLHRPTIPQAAGVAIALYAILAWSKLPLPLAVATAAILAAVAVVALVDGLWKQLFYLAYAVTCCIAMTSLVRHFSFDLVTTYGTSTAVDLRHQLQFLIAAGMPYLTMALVATCAGFLALVKVRAALRPTRAVSEQ
ncbi:hypothetical protein LMG667_17405 [Xanthomonas euvesicatoria]|uniref:hypothetical protein n=1 Tax=Xanthomonas euvesicatoria TaxID=456327 RepID=UPI00080DBC5B|nr:hypothetical protein [Xanthomonas euvesicatoria]OCG83439.1 hypothetical protein LMG667_17405 [Xanthomonas euvesicatoria]